ncbi:MAG: hypothetical protein H0U49_09690 [Parachlamydiaceae bacterium]|nr:hypothetical protein [Parachlamydiaceae bacterium]
MEQMGRHFLNVINFTFFNSANNVSNTETTKSTSKTALAPWILNTIWEGCKMLRMPLVNKALTRTTLNKPEIPSVSVNINKETFKAKVNENTIDKYTQYSVFPPYPTKPAPINKRQLEILDGSRSKDLPNFENFLKKIDGFNLSEARMELKEGVANKTPYAKLPDNARLLYDAVNLALIQEHLTHIQELANAGGGPNLKGLGLNYFEVEVQDTLSRGLAFIDKRLLDDLKIDVPLQKGDGKFEVQSYTVDRFNLSGRRENEDPKTFNQSGHPLFLLKPEDNNKNSPPLVIARGTLLADDGANGAFESVQADGRKDLSLKWISGNQDLKKAFDELYKEHGPIQVCGHSLGGNIAAVLAVSFPEHIDRVTTISAAHVSKDVYKAWLAIPIDKRPKVDNIAVEGDLVPSGGPRIIGSLIIAEQLDKKGNAVNCKNPTERHLKGFNNEIVSYRAADKTEEVNKTIRKLNSGNVNLAGSALKYYEICIKKISGSQDVKTKLPNRQDAILELRDTNPKSTREAVPSTKFELPKNLGSILDPQNVALQLALLERANPSQISDRFKDEDQKERLLDFLRTGSDNISPNLAHKLYIAFDLGAVQVKNDFKTKLLALGERNPDMKSASLLYELQKDPGVKSTQRAKATKVIKR